MSQDLIKDDIGFFNQIAKKPGVITCRDCGGWPIDSGAVFIKTTISKNREFIQAWICEICLLNRLLKRKLSGEVVER